nr:tetratricopeptide repeat protein [Ardenticatena sp.]
METRLSRLAERCIESAWLAALIVVPLFFNVYDERVFEEDKIPLLRSIVLVMLALGIIWAIERGRQAFSWDDEHPFWKQPLVLPWAGMVLVYLLTTLWSVSPRISFWGAYIRRQGAYSNLSYMLIFLLIYLILRRREQMGRLITVVLLTSTPAAIYGIIQHFGLDPLPWGGDVTKRVSSVAGNPIFIAAYLIMVVPFTIAKIIEHAGRLLRDDEDDEATLPASLLLGAYLFLLVIQGLTILYSQSRGPMIGLAVGLYFFALVGALHLKSRRQRLTASFATIAAAVFGIAFLIVFNLPNSPLADLRDAPYIGRLGRVFETESGTGRVRLLIWEGVLDLLAADPMRTLIGYGDETLYVMYPQHYKPDLAQLENRNASPDRSHNETFDALAMRGVIGFAVQLLLFASLFYYLLKWLGLIRTRWQHWLYIGLWVAGGVLGWLTPYLLTGSFALSGVAMPTGIAIGMVLYLMVYALATLKEDHDAIVAEHPHSLVLIALLAALMAHFVEIHFGIAIAATKLHFWTYAALAVVAGAQWVPNSAVLDTSPPRERRSRRRRKSKAAPRAPSSITPTLLGLSVMVALILSTLMFDLITVENQGGWVRFYLLASTWIFAALVVVAESAFEQGRSGQWLQRLGVFAAISLTLSVFYFLVHYGWVTWRPSTNGSITPNELENMVAHLANTVTLFYVWTFTLIGLGGLVLLYGDPLPARVSSARALVAWGYPVLLLLPIPIIVTTNLNVSRADVFAKQAQAYERSGQWDAAIVLHRRALDLQPHQDRYFLNLGRVYLNRAQASQNPEEQQRYVQLAEDVLQEAAETNPLNMDHWRNLASLHRAWARMETNPQIRQQHLAQADEYYQKALELAPNNASLWNDWASLALEQGDLEGAYERIQHSLSLDNAFDQTYILLASYYAQQNEWEQAREAYQKATDLNPRNIEAWSGLGVAERRLGNIQGAIQANLKALEIRPNDYITHRNLAVLYQEIGDIQSALRHAQEALQRAPERDRPALQQLVNQLQSQAGGG